jgi:hypothetical protein
MVFDCRKAEDFELTAKGQSKEKAFGKASVVKSGVAELHQVDSVPTF